MSTNTEWKPGMYCRAVYGGDGLYYEGMVMRLTLERQCVVKFLGYENSEVVPIDCLRQSHGQDERNRQINEVIAEEEFGFHSHTVEEEMDCSYMSDESLEPPKKKKCTKSTESDGRFNLSGIPSMHMGNHSNFHNVQDPAATSINQPLPPLSLMSQEAACEDEARSLMLLN